MRKEQVTALLEHADNDLKQIERAYTQALKEKEIPPSLQIDVKNLMENLRSALDYIAHDVYEIVIKPARDKSGNKEIERIYFPYGKTQTDFNSRLGSCLPELNSLDTTIYSAIESIQPHVSGDSWLYDFCTILNQKKHDTLTPQKREEKRGLNIQFPGGAGIYMGPGSSIKGSGIIQSGQARIILNNDVVCGDSPARNVTGGVTQTVVQWISFKFSDTDIVVLPFLINALANVKKLAKNLYVELDKR